MSSQTITGYLDLPTGEKIFYRAAGAQDAPTLLLLHGFPSSSHQYRNLIPLLSSKYRVIAPDLPGFGFTTTPSNYTHTFSALAKTTSTFIHTLPNAPTKYSIYIFDYGAPVGLRLALENPSAVTAIISQNGNAYAEGLDSPFWDQLQEYWTSDAPTSRDGLRGFLTYETTRWQYETGSKDPSRIAPESYTLDATLLARPGNQEIQLDLFRDYQSNVALYPEFQRYFRDSNVPVLAVWGKNDLLFVPAGAEAFRKDVKDLEVVFLDAGHFAGETETLEIAERILGFLGERGF